MKKYAFLAKLEELLAHLPEDEREDALNYYADYIDAAGKEQEETAIAALGSPDEVAQKIMEGEGIAAPAPKPAVSAVPPTPAPPHPGESPQPPKPGETPPPPSPRPGDRPAPLPHPGEHPQPPKPGEAPPPPPPRPGDRPAPPPPHPGEHPQPPKPGETPPPPRPGDRPAPPPPHPGEHPQPPKPGETPPPRPGDRPATLPPHPGEHPQPPKPKEMWKTVAVAAAAIVALVAIFLAFDYAGDRAEHQREAVAFPPTQQGGVFSQPAQSAAAQPNTAENQNGVQAIGGDTTYGVNQADGTATVTTAAPELDLSVACGDVSVLGDATVTQPTIVITGAEEGTFDVRREKDTLKLIDLRRGGTDTTPVTVTVSVPASGVREVDVEIGTGSITLEGTLPAETSAKVGTGDVTAESITVQELDAEVGTGSIRLGHVAPQSKRIAIDAETGTGDIEVTAVGIETNYKLELEPGFGTATVDGQARARGEYNPTAANELDASTGTGDIIIAFVAQ